MEVWWLPLSKTNGYCQDQLSNNALAMDSNAYRHPTLRDASPDMTCGLLLHTGVRVAYPFLHASVIESDPIPVIGGIWEPQKREPLEYAWNTTRLLRSLHSLYVPGIFLGFPDFAAPT